MLTKKYFNLMWNWFYNKKIAKETNHVITVSIPKDRNKTAFSFKIYEIFTGERKIS